MRVPPSFDWHHALKTVPVPTLLPAPSPDRIVRRGGPASTRTSCPRLRARQPRWRTSLGCFRLAQCHATLAGRCSGVLGLRPEQALGGQSIRGSVFALREVV